MARELQICISRQYGYVIMVGVGSVFLNFWLGMNVGRARRRFGIEYPRMYDDNTNLLFNCIQRAHQNTLENYPQFLMVLFIGGIDYPIASSIAGLVWLAGRIVFAHGYYSGEPRKRAYGAFGYLGMLALLMFSTEFACRLISCLPRTAKATGLKVATATAHEIITPTVVPVSPTTDTYEWMQ